MNIFEIDTSDATAQLAHMKEALSLIPGGIQLACQRAANKTMKNLRVVIKRTITTEYSVLARDIHNKITLKHASRWNPRAELHISDHNSISLAHFNPRKQTVMAESKTSSGATTITSRDGVSVKVKKAGGRKLVKGAFRLPDGAIMKRVGNKRLPITKLYGPSPFHMLENSSVQYDLQSKAQERMATNLEHEATYILKQAGLR